MSEYLCTCNSCGGIFIDPNPDIDESKKHVITENIRELVMFGRPHNYWACPICFTDDYLSDFIDC